MVRNLPLTDGETEMLLEAVADKLKEKRAAYATAQTLPTMAGFTERDFGIPQFEALFATLEAFYEGAENGN